MSDDKQKRGAEISDAQLDELLAQWAAEEIAPPDGFHEALMARLQKTASSQETNPPLAIKKFPVKKRWMSVAAAAVLVLCCLPVVQNQFGGTATGLSAQQSQNQMVIAPEEGMNDVTSTEPALSTKQVPETTQTPAAADASGSLQGQTPRTTAEQKTSGVLADQDLGSGVAKNETVTQNSAEFSQSSKDGAAENVPEDQPSATNNLEEEAMLESSMPETHQIQERAIPEGQSDTIAGSYQAAIDELWEQIEDLQRDLETCQQALQQTPDDEALSAQVSDLQKQIDAREKEIAQLEQLQTEASKDAEEQIEEDTKNSNL